MDKIFNNLVTLINNSKFLSVTLSIVFIIFGMAAVIYIIKLLGNIRSYIVNKSNSFYLNNQKIKSNGSATLSMPERVELTNSVLDLVTFMINNEITSVFKQYITLNDLYNMTNMDKDIEYVASNVANGLQQEVFTDPNLILTKEYLMRYISKKTIDLFIVVAQNHNTTLRNAN